MCIKHKQPTAYKSKSRGAFWLETMSWRLLPFWGPGFPHPGGGKRSWGPRCSPPCCRLSVPPSKSRPRGCPRNGWWATGTRLVWPCRRQVTCVISQGHNASSATDAEASWANLRRSRVLGAGADPAAAADGVGEPLVVPHLREAQSSLATHTHGQGPAAGVWLLHVNHLEGHRHDQWGLRPPKVNDIHEHLLALLTSRIGMMTWQWLPSWLAKHR